MQYQVINLYIITQNHLSRTKLSNEKKKEIIQNQRSEITIYRSKSKLLSVLVIIAILLYSLKKVRAVAAKLKKRVQTIRPKTIQPI